MSEPSPKVVVVGGADRGYASVIGECEVAIDLRRSKDNRFCFLPCFVPLALPATSTMLYSLDVVLGVVEAVGKGGLMGDPLYALDSRGVEMDRFPRVAGFVSGAPGREDWLASVANAASLLRFLRMPIDKRLTIEGRLVVTGGLSNEDPIDLVGKAMAGEVVSSLDFEDMIRPFTEVIAEQVGLGNDSVKKVVHIGACPLITSTASFGEARSMLG